MHKVRIKLGALRPARTVAIAVMASGWALAQFMSQLAPLQPQQPAFGLPPGTELIYQVISASHPGPNAGSDARLVAGEGFRVVTVHDWGETGCVLTTTMYALHPLDGSLGSVGGQPVLGTPDTCGDIWRSGQALAGAARTTDPDTTIGSGPLEVNGRTYDALTINNDPQQGRPYSRAAYDRTTGVLVFSSSGYGDRSWGATPTMASQSSIMQLLEVRRPQLPWSAHGPLPASLSGLTGLSYEGQRTLSFPAVTMYATGVVSQLTAQYRLRQATTNWLLFDVQTTVSVPGAPPVSDTGASLVSGSTGHHIPPEVLARLTPGQLLDSSPHLGMQVTVEQDEAGYAVIASRAKGYASYAFYDRATGLQVAVRIEERNQDTLTYTEVWLTGTN